MKSDPVNDFSLLLILSLIILVLIGQGHCATSAPRHTNEMGAIIEYTNPMTYNFGVIKDATLVRKGARIGTNLRFQPYGTFALYTEQVLLCGPPTDELINRANGPIVLVYKREAHEAVDGVACHDFEGAFSVGEQK
jgi:hypothetical protein